MKLKRSRKQRVELQFAGKTAVQVYDGANGWKLRPYLNRLDVEPYTQEELKAASMQSDLDGPLVDYAAKGSKIELVGMEKVEDRDAFKIKVTFKNGQSQHIWVDAETFLESKMEGTPRRLDGAYHPVEVYFRDYREMHGLMIPFLLETRVLLNRPAQGLSALSEKIVLTDVAINPILPDALFARPQAAAAAAAEPAPAPAGGNR
ncbi:MAG: outer membrane lipoprotein-sorting protein [Acidobacteria bacterium]|nr:outer membrane lipoprotein-sorting protein [Acidobacteriota bacterium]